MLPEIFRQSYGPSVPHDWRALAFALYVLNPDLQSLSQATVYRCSLFALKISEGRLKNILLLRHQHKLCIVFLIEIQVRCFLQIL